MYNCWQTHFLSIFYIWNETKVIAYKDSGQATSSKHTGCRWCDPELGNDDVELLSCAPEIFVAAEGFESGPAFVLKSLVLLLYPLPLQGSKLSKNAALPYSNWFKFSAIQKQQNTRMNTGQHSCKEK